MKSRITALTAVLAFALFASAMHAQAQAAPDPIYGGGCGPLATPTPTPTAQPTAAPIAHATGDSSTLALNANAGKCYTTATATPSKTFLRMLPEDAVSRDVPMLSYFGKAQPVGWGYISSIEGWAAYGLRCTADGKTLVRVYTFIDDGATRCMKNAMMPDPFHAVWDYTGECN